MELPKLKTKEERFKNLMFADEPFPGHNEKKKKFNQLLNEEFKELGLKSPYKEEK